MNAEHGIGEGVRRKEDFTLLTGQGRYSDDIHIEGRCYAYVLRSPHAHAVVRGVETTAAAAVPGVLVVLTGADYLADGLQPIPGATSPNTNLGMNRPNGQPAYTTPIYPLVIDKARRAGEAVALVVAETLAQAKDAAEQIAVDYDPLPSVTDGRAALADGAPLVWHDAPNNISIDDGRGDKAAADAAFAAAAHTVSLELFNNRVTGVPMEPRAATAVFDETTGGYTLYAGSGSANRQRDALSHIFSDDDIKLRVLSGNVGGAFGTRGMFYPEFALTLWAAKRVGRPVKWVCERSEAFLSDAAGRDQFTRVELALDADGKFLALRTAHIANLGSHGCSFTPLTRGISVTTGVYDIPVVDIDAKAVFTNTNPIHTYRGAGRPEAMYVMERIIDKAAAETGIDGIELRRRNAIPPSAMPYENLTGMTFDSGEFEINMDMALELADWNGFKARKADARARGKLLGRGICNYIETATGQPVERAELHVIPDDARMDIVIGTQDSGQGHATSYAQLITEWFGVPFDDIRMIEGDTDVVKLGAGSHSSRSMRLAGYLMGQARDDILDRGKHIAAHMLEASATDIEFADAAFTVAGTDHSVGLFDVAREAETNGDLPEDLQGPLEADAEIHKMLATFPNGCHIVEVEIDADTGGLAITRYAGIDDVGRVINPILVDGQTHGGIAQGVGQALMEDCTYDAAGQLVAGTFMDYCMPRADDFPEFKLHNNEVMATNNPLGIKGAGEGGTTGAPPAVINAVVDALSEFGVRHIDMPATPERIWRAIHEVS